MWLYQGPSAFLILFLSPWRVGGPASTFHTPRFLRLSLVGRGSSAASGKWYVSGWVGSKEWEAGGLMSSVCISLAAPPAPQRPTWKGLYVSKRSEGCCSGYATFFAVVTVEDTLQDGNYGNQNYRKLPWQQSHSRNNPAGLGYSVTL